MRNKILFFLFLLMIATIYSCGKDDTGDDIIIQKVDLYEILDDVVALEEPLCADSLPYFQGSGAEYRFNFEKNVFLNRVKMNDTNPKQWIFSRIKIDEVSRGTVYYTEKLYTYNLQTNKAVFIDSAVNGFESIDLIGSLIAYSSWPKTYIFNIATGVRQDVDGRDVSLSPSGVNMKVNDGRIKFYAVENLELLLDERYGNGGPSNILWKTDYEFISFTTIWENNEYTSVLTNWNLLNKTVDTIFIKEGSHAAIPKIWLEKPNTFMMGRGHCQNIETTELVQFYDYCENKYYDDFIDIGKGNEFIGQKVYYTVDEEKKEVIYSSHFHLLKPYEGVEKRIKFVFDTDEF